MKNLQLTVALISALTLTICTTSTLFAATLKCTVVEVDEQEVILNCGDAVEKLNKGTEVKVKTVRKKATIEGC